MAAQTPAEHFADQDSWGNYQFITLKEMVDDLLADTTDTDSYLQNTKRSQLVRQLKRGIRKVNRVTKKMYHAVQITVGSNLYFALPQNYVDWQRVSVVDDNDRLQPLNINHNINTADGYLQNFEHEILFNNDGELLLTDMANAYQKPYKKYTFNPYIGNSLYGNVGYGYGYGYGFGTNGDYRDHTSDPRLASKYGDFKVNDDRGTMHFSSNLEDRDIVIEYLSDGLDLQTLQESEIKIHKHMQDAVKWFAISEIIATRRSVNQYQISSARRRYKTELHRAKLLSLKFNFLTIGREFNSMPE